MQPSNMFNQNAKGDDDSENVLIVGASFTINGDLTGQGTIIISGIVTGDIKSQKIMIAPGAQVMGNVHCEKLDISGAIKGIIEANSIVVRHGGILDGEIHYLNIATEEGGEILGKIQKIGAKSNAPESFSSERSNAATVSEAENVSIDFPEKVRQSLKENPAYLNQMSLTLVDGSKLPPWLSLKPDGQGMFIEAKALEKLASTGQKVSVRLHYGEQSYDFVISV